jgi:two-component system, NarL family, response regulator NreC
MGRSKIRVLVADDQHLVRSGIAAMIRLQPDMELVGEAENGRVAARLAREVAPDVVLMDVTMPDLNGIDATREVAALGPPAPKVIALSGHSDRRFVAGVLKAGAAGYVVKDAAPEELAAAIRAVSADKGYLSPQVAGAVVDDHRKWVPSGASAQFAALTPRERQVLQLMAEGKSTKTIAATLYVGKKTVDTHRANIMTKLNVDNMAELVKYAIREGLTTVGE